MWKILCKKDRSGGAEFNPFKSFKSFKPMKSGRAMQASDHRSQNEGSA